MARLWRAYHADLPAQQGAALTLQPEEAHHIHRVLRLQPGERIAVFDGQGNEWRAVIEASGASEVRIRLEIPLGEVVEPVLEVVLFQGQCRLERMDWLVQKCVEVGVSAVLPVAMARGRTPGVSERRLARWRRIAVEACKQSGRRRVPRIEACDALPTLPATGSLGLLLDPGATAVPLGDLCARDGTHPVSVWLAVGPEGGFEASEITAAERRGWRRTGLGPRTLRSDTAGLVAASILLHLWADLGSGSASTARC